MMRFLFTILPIMALLPASTLSDATGRELEDQRAADSFHELLNQVDPQALRGALAEYSPQSFKQGLFPDNTDALKAINSQSPEIAQGIIRMALLKKRQINGTVTSFGTAPATTFVTTVPFTSTAIVLPSSPALQSSTSSIISLKGLSINTPSSSAAPSSTAPPSSFITSTPASGPMTSTAIGLISMNTNAGREGLVTAFTVVGGGSADHATGTAKQDSTAASAAQPGLQTSVATISRGLRKEVALVLGAAVGVACML